MNHTPIFVCGETTDALTFSHYPPLQAIPQNYSPKIPMNVYVVCLQERE